MQKKKSRWTSKFNWGFWILIGAFGIFLIIRLIARSQGGG